jgi:hypothetical protein
VDENWKVRIERPIDALVVRIWIYQDRMDDGGRSRLFITDLTKGAFTLLEAGKTSESIKPTIELADRMADPILSALLTGLAKEGYEYEDEEKKPKGDELKATKYHLEDMREIVAHNLEVKRESKLNKRGEADPGF